MSLESPYKVGTPCSLKEMSTLDSTRNFMTPNKSTPSKVNDRFIPSNVKSNLYELYFNENSFIEEESSTSDLQSRRTESLILSENQNYSNLLKRNVVQGANNEPSDSFYSFEPEAKENIKLLTFSTPKKAYKENYTENFNSKTSSPKIQREIQDTPYKVLDAPGLSKDFYLNLLDWSKEDIIAVALDNIAYAWSKCKLMRICELEEPNYISSISWAPNGIDLTIGTSEGKVKLFDIEKDTEIRAFASHEGRVCNLKWNGSLLCSAGRDGNITLNDVRVQSNVVSFSGHESEICGLQWSPDGSNLATGANDNKVKVWSLKTLSNLASFSNHTAAIKALAWSPHHSHLLVSGGGTSDKFIRFWNLNTLTQVKAVNTNSQICNLQFSRFENELVSTHGYNSNQVIVWDAATMKSVACLQGHTERIFYCASSPCGRELVTGAGDETLRFWRLFGKNDKKNILHSKCSPSSFDLR